MTIKEVYDFFDLIFGKERGEWLSPEEKDSYFHRAQMWLFNEMKSDYAVNQDYQDALKPFVVEMSFTTTVSSVISMPAPPAENPYEHFLSGRIQYYDNAALRTRYKGFKTLNEDELAERLDSQILAPTVTDPVGEQHEPRKVKLYPIGNVYAGYVKYLRTPKPPKMAYSGSGGNVTYVPGTSVQLEWNESSLTKIIMKALQFAGVPIDEQFLVQYTELKGQQNV
jgi:hypothetical protein